MRPFSLEEYLKDPSKKIITRDGRKARIVCTDKLGEYPICALIKENEKTECFASYTLDGKCGYGYKSDYDLFFAPEKKEGWINIFKGITNDRLPGIILHKTKEEAIKSIYYQDSYIDTIKIEWEE